LFGATANSAFALDALTREQRDKMTPDDVIAMAKAGNEPAGAAGSQFFVVTATNAGLPPDYAILGVVTKGLKVVERIGRLGDPVTEKPTRRVVVLRMTVM